MKTGEATAFQETFNEELSSRIADQIDEIRFGGINEEELDPDEDDIEIDDVDYSLEDEYEDDLYGDVDLEDTEED